MSTAPREPADAARRAAALDPGRSFLVQAPAGSGKTELLIQRYLGLLAVATAPEEILAITFTRKAAAEMRSRIIEALERARGGAEPAAPHLRLGYALARQAVRRDEEQGWNLHAQPGRLRVGTIDSVNAWLSARAPLTGGSTALLRVADQPQALYDEAARATVALVAETGPESEAVASLLGHFDNRAQALSRVIAAMLARRDQWLRHTGAGPGDRPGALRRALEASLAALVQARLAALAAELSPELCTELLALLREAGAHAREHGITAPLLAWADAAAFPAPAPAALPLWQALARTFLTTTGQWRKPGGLDRRTGFPADARARRDRAREMLAALTACPGLEAGLAEVLNLPSPVYHDDQWQVLEALLRVLPVAAALLQQVFVARGEVDFHQVAQDALAALGREDAPSELGLGLDYALRHILLDEFQDTSRSQYDLLRALTAGWEPGDGRSLFLVGDPMQSIYRFREADVGVYLRTQVEGIGQLRPEFLQLETNFRAEPALVDWVNTAFAGIFPAAADASLGAVPFKPSQAHRQATPGAGVYWEFVDDADAAAAASRVAEVVARCATAEPESSIGVLVRSRAHARRLGPLLRAAGIEFGAPDLELMVEEAAVQDLLGLTRALLHLADRTAWLAVLRAPWCGLTLADLDALAGGVPAADIWGLLQDDQRLGELSADGQDRARRLRARLAPWLTRRGGCALRELVEGAWLWLGGPATLDNAATLDLAAAYFDFLDEVDAGGDCAEPAELHSLLEQRPVARGAADARVQIMTMHKAKGLEFDVVVLPGLGLGTRREDRPPLLWHEAAADELPPVLAPVNATGDEREPLFEYLWALERRRAAFERDRLLYVAATRARRQLWLFAGLTADAQGMPGARSGSLLASLWPAAGHLAPAPPVPPAAAAPAGPAWFEVPLRRLPAGWQAPPRVAGEPPDWSRAAGAEPTVEYDWASRWAMHVGTVVHRWLESLADAGDEALDPARLAAARPQFRRLLARLGTRPGDLDRATERVVTALQNCVNDPVGRWLLAGDHREARRELALGVPESGGFRTVRVDRCFVDAGGDRWIVDYKTSTHEGRDLDAFVASEVQRYRAQLRDYRRALQGLAPGPVRTALYFPLLGVWREVNLDAGPADSE